MAPTAKVEFVPLRNDLANLPSSLSNLLFSANIPAQRAVVEIQPKQGSPVFCGWTGLSSASSDRIELDPTFATNLGLLYGMECKISIKPKVPEAHSVLLTPVDVADWEIVETNAAFLEAFMINQVRVVAPNKLVTVFPTSTTLAALKVDKIEPDVGSSPVALLSPECEVIIAPRVRETQTEQPMTEKRASVPQSVVVRATVHPYLPNLDSPRLIIYGDLAGFVPNAKVSVCSATPSTLAPSVTSSEEEVPRAKDVVATYVPTDEPIVGLSYGLACALGLKNGVGTRVRVKTIKQDFPSITATVRPFTTAATSKLSFGKSESVSCEELELDVVGRGLFVPPYPNVLPLGGVIDSSSPEWGLVKSLKIGAAMPLAESKLPLSLEKMSGQTQKKKHPIVGQDDLLNNMESLIMNGNGVLLYGSRGCGKSVVISELVSRVRAKHIRPIFFKCGNYTDKAVSTVRDGLRKVSYEALWSAPSLIVFDDINKVVPAEQEYGNSSRQQQIAEIVSGALQPLIESGRVSVLASAQDQADVHSFLLASHLLESVIHLKSPDKDLREQILREALAKEGLTAARDLDLLEVVAETEGYQPGDIWVLVERLNSMMALDGGSEVTTELSMAATKDFVPASLRGVKLEKPPVKWSEIGGLNEAKTLVLETLEWPTKYAPVFANCPLRLRSGLLFYGYPGCGKTMLASAIASQTGLNFISVKGPEILNKYIGASEQSVRDLFDRAQAAKPCVIFFDEFDAIAPKRGHDATGVTDRVVNQLLTQMDGAEGLDGVYVLAATSRPDLIDSALLRPGRLDKSVLCDMPDVEARLDILQRAAAKLNVSPDLDLRAFAEKIDGFSGADVQALIYNAYLKGVHVSLDAVENTVETKTNKGDLRGFQIGSGDLESARSYINTSTEPGKESAHLSRTPVSIGHEEMSQALKESKPSISRKELARFKAIYSEFSTDRDGEMPPGTSSNEIGARVTLQ